jgi:hypothetical protein
VGIAPSPLLKPPKRGVVTPRRDAPLDIASDYEGQEPADTAGSASASGDLSFEIVLAVELRHKLNFSHVVTLP